MTFAELPQVHAIIAGAVTDEASHTLTKGAPLSTLGQRWVELPSSPSSGREVFNQSLREALELQRDFSEIAISAEELEGFGLREALGPDSFIKAGAKFYRPAAPERGAVAEAAAAAAKPWLTPRASRGGRDAATPASTLVSTGNTAPPSAVPSGSHWAKPRGAVGVSMAMSAARHSTGSSPRHSGGSMIGKSFSAHQVIASDGFGWLQMASDGSGWLRMAPDGS